MPIEITDFGGIVPKLNAERLPDNCAQEAFNCDVSSGALGPLRVTGPFDSLHEADLTLKAGIPAGDVKAIPKPTAPSVSSLSYLAQPANWLNIHATDWVSYINDAGVRIVTRARAQNLRLVGVWYAEADLYIVAYLPFRIYTFQYGGPYALRGPRYQFVFRPFTNGPDQTLAFPIVTSEGDPEFAQMRVPLVDENSQIYAEFEVADVWGPRYDEDILVTDFAYINWLVGGAYVMFRISMNYTQPRRKHLYYVSAAVDGYLREGPPSEISAKIVQKPGQKLTLNTPRPRTGYPTLRLYRAGTTRSEDFRLIDDTITAATYTDWKESETDEIPPFGNFPGGDKTAFLRGSHIHPAHFGVALYNQKLYLSDVYRLHAWPEEYILPFKGAFATALTGATTLVFGRPEVWAVYGNNPEFMQKQLLATNYPLLNVAGLCKRGDVVYWPTYDGLAASSGNGIEIVTSEHFTRKQWLALKPEKMIATVADDSIFLTHGDDVEERAYLRFDSKEKLAAVTTYDSVTNGDYRWRSKEFYFEQATIIDYLRVVADGPVTLTVYADRAEAQTLTVDTDEPIPLNAAGHTGGARPPGRISGPILVGSNPNTPDVAVVHARQWSFEVQGDAVVRRIEAHERVVHDVETELRLNAENTRVWRSTWARFMDAQRWAVMQVSAQTTLPIWVRVYADGTKVYEQQHTNGRAFALPRTLPKANLWNIDLESPVRIDSLYATRRRVVDAGNGIRELNDGPFAPWLAKTYQFTDDKRVTSVIVHASRPVNMNVYYDGAIGPSETVAVPNSGEVKLTLGLHDSVEFDFNGDDAAVREVLVFVARVETVGPEGINIANPVSTRGLLFKFADCAQLAVGSIGATDYTDAGNLRVTIKADGATVWNAQRVTNGKAFALPHTFPDATLWEIDITGGGEIHSIVFLPRTPEVLQGRTVFSSHPRTIPPWMHKRYTFALGATRLISAWAEVAGGGQVRMRLYLDGASEPTKIVVLGSRVETLLSLPSDCAALDVDFNADDCSIVEFGLFGLEVGDGDHGGISTGPRANWRRLQWRFADRAEMACAVVGARSYSGVKFALKGDGVQVRGGSIGNGRFVKIPRSAGDASLWEADIEAPAVGVVEDLVLVPRRGVQANGALQRTRTAGIPPWLYERYEFTDRQRIRSVIVDADSYPVTMRLYYDRSAGISQTVTVPNAREVLVNSDRVHGAFEFDFLDDGVVRDVTVFPMEEQLIGPEGIVLTNPASTRGLAYKFVDSGAFAAGSVGTSAYPVTVSLNGQAITVEDGGMFLFPRDMAKASRWVIDIDPGTAEIYSVVLVPWVRVDAGAAIRETRPEVGLPPWLTRIYQFVDEAWPGAAIVHADSYPVTMRLFIDGEATPIEIVVENADELRLTEVSTANELRIDFDGDDTRLREVVVFTKVVQSAPDTVQINGPSFRRNLVRFAEPHAFACGMVTVSDNTNGTLGQPSFLRLYADGMLAHTERLTGPGPFALPADLVKARVWEVDVETSSNVTGVTLVPWARAAWQGPLRGVNQTGEIPRWLYTEFVLDAPFKPRSAVVLSDTDVPLDLYLDGVHKRYMLSKDVETYFAEDAPEGRTVRFRMGGKERLVRAVTVFNEEVVPVENGGVIVRPAQGMAAWRNKVLEFRDTGSWRVGRVVATQYPVVLTLYRARVAVDAVTVEDGRPFKFQSDLPNAKQWGLDVETSGDVRELILIARDALQITNGAVRITKAEDPFAWIGRRVLSARPVNFSACRVEASAYPVRVRLYDAEAMDGVPDGGSNRPYHVPVVDMLAKDGRPFRLPRARPERLWEIDIDAPDGVAVYDVAIGTSMDGVR